MQDLSLSEFFLANETSLWLLGAVSLLTFVGTLIVVPWLVVRIPEDYFALGKRRLIPWSGRHPVIRWLLLIVKNIAGGILVVMGIAMLVLPGQGLLTVLIGMILMNFPGKYRFERWLVQRRPVLRSVNWLRRYYGRPPLSFG